MPRQKGKENSRLDAVKCTENKPGAHARGIFILLYPTAYASGPPGPSEIKRSLKKQKAPTPTIVLTFTFRTGFLLARVMACLTCSHLELHCPYEVSGKTVHRNHFLH